MSEFKTPLKLMVLRSRTFSKRPLYELTEPLIYYSDVLGFTLTVPPGTRTDLASIPYLPVIWLAFGDTAAYAAVPHDYLYKYAGFVPGSQRYIPKFEADMVFEEAMRLRVQISGTDVDDPPVPWLPRKVMYQAVTLQSSYPQPKEQKT